MPTVHPIKVELAKRGQTQTRFAPVVGVSPGTLGQVLNGRVSAWPALRRRCAEALEVPETDLFPAPENGAERLVERTTAEQGLPLRVEDPVVLQDVAGALRGAAS